MWDHAPREGSVAVASSTNRFFMQRAAPRIAGALRRAGQQRFAGGVNSGTNARYFASFARSDVLSRRESHLPPTPSPLVREFHVSPRAETWPVTIGIGIAVGALGLRYTVEVRAHVAESGCCWCGPANRTCVRCYVAFLGHSLPPISCYSEEFTNVGTLFSLNTMLGVVVEQAWNKWRESQPKGAMLAARYYKGPFEDEMSRSEAAKILGVRCVHPPADPSLRTS